ncbi:MAG: hypothetical protein GY941_22705 [Planctomycetes bacterium]|nr:hypothetical protein [Planctomycetota bacterium]
MKKKTNLADAMQKEAVGPKEKPAVHKKEKKVSSATYNVAPSRVGKKPLTAFFDPDAIKQLKLIGIEEDKTLQSMTEEAINDYFAKHGKAQIA